MREDGVKIYVAGHSGLVGASVARQLELKGFTNLVVRTRDELDLSDDASVRKFFRSESPQWVVACAAKVGGIQDNLDHPAEYLYENLQIQNNLIWSAKEARVRKFLLVGSSCIYPGECPQPMREEFALDGRPEFENEAYAYSKIMGLKLCQYVRRQFGLDFFTCVPTNIYGNHDDFAPGRSHVIPALIHRLHTAKVASLPEVEVWGAASTRRDFMHADDLADAMIWLMTRGTERDYINVGTGNDVSIEELAHLLKDVVGYPGRINFDASRPAGRPRRLLDVSHLSATGWTPKVELKEGLARTYAWYLAKAAG